MRTTGLSTMKQLLLLMLSVAAQNDDLFNYGTTNGRNFGPEDWDQVACDDLENCTGWPEKWLTAQGWSLEENSCRHCPQGLSTCGEHHQSPINLRRQSAQESSSIYNICRDQHWMKFEDGSCNWKHLENSFSIERHSLKLAQPIEYGDGYGVGENGEDYGFRIDCEDPSGAPRRFARIDFSWGFNFWWYFSHIDIKVPSEHTQNGKRYSAEVQMAHFFSTYPENDRQMNEMATIVVFLDAHDDWPPYPHLDRMICQWRKAEAKIREECGLEPVASSYPSCFEPDQQQSGRRARRTTVEDAFKQAASKGERVVLEDVNYRSADLTDDEFAAFIQDYSDRNLIENEHLSFHNYQFLIDCKTEYYHRYHGTQTIPPCFGPLTYDSHENTNHWRIMKDPIRIATRQIVELERLLKVRIAPPDAVHNECENDTAGVFDPLVNSTISVARPLQANDQEHNPVFCWCPIWPSHWPEDRAWCTLNDQLGTDYVFYEHPYNWDSGGAF